MKKLFAVLCLLYSGITSAKIPDNIIASCLYEKSVDSAIHYRAMTPTTYISDNITISNKNYSSPANAVYFLDRGKKVGYVALIKAADGLLYHSKMYPFTKTVNLTSHPLPIFSEFDYTLVAWSEITSGKKRYLCLNVPFNGVGQSGGYQNIRNLILLDIFDNKLYYTVETLSSQQAGQ